MLYFAYGSNMNHAQMAQRCLGYRFVDAAALEGHKFVYDGHSDARFGPVANIVQQSKDDVVWGGLFEITEQHLAALDEYEGYPDQYQRKEVNVITMEGDLVSAVTYYKRTEEISAPSDEYRDIVLQGAEDCGLPGRYIKDNL